MAKKARPKSSKTPAAKKKSAAAAPRAAARPRPRPVKPAKPGKKAATKARMPKAASKPAAVSAVVERAPAKKTVRGKTKSEPRKARAVTVYPTDSDVLDTLDAQSKQDAGLTAMDLELFQQMLLEKRAEILGDVSTLRNEASNKDRHESAGDMASMPIHMADIGTDNYELEFTLGLIEGERAILREIDEALERIKQGSYGLCIATGKPIGKSRLKAKPWAKHCYEYALAEEQGRARRV